MTVAALLTARDLSSNVGANLALVREVAGLDPWSAGKKELMAALEVADRAPVPQQDSWRVQALQKLLNARLTAHFSEDTAEETQLQSFIKSIVIN